jgi:hypothetical protein
VQLPARRLSADSLHRVVNHAESNTEVLAYLRDALERLTDVVRPLKVELGHPPQRIEIHDLRPFLEDRRPEPRHRVRIVQHKPRLDKESN